ncbi:hypothetical protein F0P96_10680 [Hymenobacter busanensis]|uniref:Uncharacterized protein n=1 Tax=Hymenobacter busanensis TaxID=2607656 RepID=A0A7L4ZY83_9BACT|nr:hypothetical protein [Hymenobacter busanensis]KAA9333426.1 hypothetical protein F0P96_10680 [Hymenobacter busanensis]QHJ07893.1 hypothetical protein GUY19_11620 [Hymenobacter busanensis]
MTNEEITNLLPSGAQTRIAKQVGVSKQAVSKALQGKLKGAKADRILKEATEQAQQEARRQRAAAERARLVSMTDEELLSQLDSETEREKALCAAFYELWLCCQPKNSVFDWGTWGTEPMAFTLSYIRSLQEQIAEGAAYCEELSRANLVKQGRICELNRENEILRNGQPAGYLNL